MLTKYYVLDGHEPVPVARPLEWAAWFDAPTTNRHVGLDRFHDDRVTVSTVFLGLDHQWGDGPPLLFETMAFGGWFHDYQRRYATWDEAAHGHAQLVTYVLWWSVVPVALQVGLRRGVILANRAYWRGQRRWQRLRGFLRERIS